MPAIICVSLADADFSDLRWELLIGIMLGKIIIFVLVAGCTIIITGNHGVAGLLSIYCVQSNDLPVGNPLLSSLYKDVRPQMLKYLFFMPAFTIIFLVPIGNIMIEEHKIRKLKLTERSDSNVYVQNNKMHMKEYLFVINKKRAKNIICNLGKSPVILATAAGIILNFMFSAKVPAGLHQPIQVVAATIPGLALSILGFSMVRKERHIISSSIGLATLLSAVKMILTPIVLHSIVKALDGGKTSRKFLSDFALLYGIISPATVVFQMGQEYRKPLAAMGASLILTSFMCFPLSYVVAKFTVAPVHKFNSYIPLLEDTLLYVAFLSMASTVFVMVSLVRKKRSQKVPCRYIKYLTFTQFILACGVVFNYESPLQQWSLYTSTALFYGGEIATYFWCAMMAVILVLSKRYPTLAIKGFTLFILASFGLSALIVITTCLLMSSEDIKYIQFFGQPRDQFNFLLLTITSLALVISSATVGVCLLFYSRRENISFRSSSQALEESENYKNKAKVSYIDISSTIYNPCEKKNSAVEGVATFRNNENDMKLYYEEIIRSCENASKLAFGRKWTARIFIFLLIIWITMMTKLIANLFKLFRSHAVEIMVPLEYLQASLFVGQGIYTFLIFGIDMHFITASIIKWWRKRFSANEKDLVSSTTKQKNDMLAFYNQFFNYYYTHCFQELAKEREWKKNYYKDSFWGHQLVDWLINEGICKDDDDAVEYGENLLLCGIIKHVRSAHQFHNAPYLYNFITRKENTPKS